MEKKKKWMIFGGTAVVVVGVFLCIAAFFLYKGVTLFFDREIVADQYLEQMTSAASQGDRDAMRSLYMPGAVPEEHMERQIQENVDIWGKSQLDSFKKKGLNIRTSTKNGVKTKSVECSYGIKTEDGKRFTAILNRMESSDGNQGIISFIIRDNVSLAPQGTLRSISHWNVFQWGLFLLSLIMIFSTIATAVICYRQNPRYKWGWIILILIAYLSMGFSVIRTPNTWEFKVNWSAATVRLSRYVTYENGSREFRLFLPAGMAVYWIMKKRLDRESVHKKYGDREAATKKHGDREAATKKHGDREAATKKHGNWESGQEKRGNRESVHKKHENQEPGPENRADQEPGPKKRADQEPGPENRADQEPGPKKRADQEPGPEKRADRETRQEQRPDTDRESWRIP
ncbi:hypothetical protein [Enterocloster bolteae]|uniref:hypothetical protein n=1 Tax=Enterocloster bolteae TaxID=208479 RepID=UPI002A7F4245|nr:hypothetical protein [Enterocloster bolteae]